jgi:hypothetical protein
VKTHRHTPEQVVRKLREGDRLSTTARTSPRSAHAGDLRGALAPLAGRLRRDEGRRGEAAQGAGEAEPAPTADGRRPGVGHRHAQGAGGGKLLTPDRRPRAVGHLQHRFGVSKRRACRLARQHAPPTGWPLRSAGQRKPGAGPLTAEALSRMESLAYPRGSFDGNADGNVSDHWSPSWNYPSP